MYSNDVSAITDQNTISFPRLGIDVSIDPTAFSIFGFNIQWYGIIIIAGLFLALLYTMKHTKRFGLDSDRVFDVIIAGVLGGIVGARLYYVAINWSEYKNDLLEIINTRNGGLAIYGGVIGAFIVGCIMCKIRKVKVLPMTDMAALGLLIGQGIGRWGNFINQECFGTNTDSVFGMTGGRIQSVIINEMQPGGALYNSNAEMIWNKTVHPCFLYESVWCILGFLILSFWSKRRKYDGQILLMYMAWYGAERFIVEGLRTDSLMLGGIRVSQAVSAIIFIVSVILQIVFFFRRKRDPESFVLYAGTEESRLIIEEGRRKKMGISLADAKVAGDDDDDVGILPDEDEEEYGAGILPHGSDDDDDDDVGILPDEDDDDDDEAFLTGAAAEKAEEIKEAVSEKAEELSEAVSEKAEELTEAVSEKAEEIKDKVAEAAEEAAGAAEDALEDKYAELAEAVDEKLTGGSGKGSHSKKKKHHKK